MKVIYSGIFKMVMFGCLILLGIIFSDAFMKTGSPEVLEEIAEHPQYAVWSLVFLIFAVLCLVFHLIETGNKKQLRFIQYFSVILLLLGQMVLFVNLDVVHITDDYYVLDQAWALARGLQTQIDTSSTYGYFTIYGNNYFILFLIMRLSKLCDFLHIADTERALVLFNIFLIDLSVFFLYRTAAIQKGKKGAVKVLVLCALNPINYLFIFWTYTCTFCLPLMTGVVYVAALMLRGKGGLGRQICRGIILSLMCVMGYYLRPVVLIPLIAIVMYWIMTNRQWKKKMKKYALVGLCMALAAGAGVGLVKRDIHRYISSTEGNFPVTHWLMLGLHNGYDFSDVLYTGGFETKEERVQANLEEIKRTLKEYGALGTIDYAVDKVSLTWSLGTATYTSRMGDVRAYNGLQKWITDDKSDLVIVYCQAFRILTLLLAIVSIWKRWRRKQFDENFLYILILFGGIVFYLFWEPKSAYSIPFIPFLLMLSEDSVDFLWKEKRSAVAYALNCGLSVLIIATILASLVFCRDFTEREWEFSDKVISAFSSEFLWMTEDLSSGDHIITQEFYANGSFNQIRLRCRTIEEADCSYRVILRKNGEEVEHLAVSQEDVRRDVLTLDIGEQIVQGKQKYVIEISPVEAGKADSIGWCYHTSSTYDDYEGTSCIDGTPCTYDYVLEVRNNQEGVYCSSAAYWTVVGIALLVQIFMLILVRRFVKTSDEILTLNI